MTNELQRNGIHGNTVILQWTRIRFKEQRGIEPDGMILLWRMKTICRGIALMYIDQSKGYAQKFERRFSLASFRKFEFA